MARIAWSIEALSDIERLDAFLRPKSPQAAERAILAIMDAIAGLADFPAIGRPAETIGPEYRELVVPFGASGYLVLYRYDGSDVVILAARHFREAGS